MRKLLLTLSAAAALSGSWVVEAAPNDGPEARAYLSYAFGGHSRYAAPLRYGLRMDMTQPIVAPSTSRLGEGTGLTQEIFERPAAMKLEADLFGNATASVAGIPFAGRVVRLNDDGSSGGGAPAPSTPGGFTWFDWSLLGVGVGGLGFLIAKATADKDSHN